MIFLYRLLTTFFYPIFIILIYYRKLIKKEDSVRYKEKIFSSNFNVSRKHNSKLIWFHAASIGELKSIVPIINNLNQNNKSLEFLVTTITLSSSNLAKEIFKNQKNIHHRFFPLDILFLLNKFIMRWKPDIVIIVETEIRPNLIHVVKKSKIPLAIINTRITKKTFKRWFFFPKTAKKIFGAFDLCLAANEETKDYLKTLNAKNIYCLGNIKFINETKLIYETVNEDFLSNNLIWCAVSTHETEEELCLKAHCKLKEQYSEIKTIIAPRHINRVKSIKKLCATFNLQSQILDKNEKIHQSKEVIIINSFGRINEFLKFARSAFIGKSTIKKLEDVGGQNPIDAAKLGCNIYHGPYIYNFKEIYDFLEKNKVSKLILNPDELSDNLLKDFKNSKEKSFNFLKIMNDLEKKTLSQTMNIINKFLINEIRKT